MCAEVLPGVSLCHSMAGYFSGFPLYVARDFVRGVRVRDGRRLGAGVPQPQPVSLRTFRESLYFVV